MKSKVSTGGLGLIGALTLIFVVLKLTNLISWTWLWVLSPLWIAALLIILVVSLVLVVGRIRKGAW